MIKKKFSGHPAGKRSEVFQKCTTFVERALYDTSLVEKNSRYALVAAHMELYNPEENPVYMYTCNETTGLLNSGFVFEINNYFSRGELSFKQLTKYEHFLKIREFGPSLPPYFNIWAFLGQNINLA